MKTKIFTMMAVIVACGLISTSAVSGNSEVKSTSAIQVSAVEDDLRCIIRDENGNKLAACWFCDCSAIAKAIFTK